MRDFRTMGSIGGPGDDLRERRRVAYESREYDFVHVHTKMPDDAGHAKDPVRKKEVLESLDGGMNFAVDQIASDPEVLLVVTADHSTASSGGVIHTGEA